MVGNKEIAEILDEIGTLLELKGENPFKCRAYHNAARTVNSLTHNLIDLLDTGEIREIKGIGDALAEKITELLTTGKLQYYENLKNSVPDGLLTMLRVQGLGPKKVKILYHKLNIQNLEQLKQAAEEHKLADLDGFGDKTEENILKGLEILAKHADKYLYPTARVAADRILDILKTDKGVIRCEIAGSIRRHKEIIGDIDILISARSSAIPKIMNLFISHPDVERISSHGATKSSVVLKTGMNCDLRVVNDDEFPFALCYFTGSKEHNIEMRSLAKDFGWSLNEYGFSNLVEDDVRKKTKRIVSCKDEKDIYAALRLAYIPPELREGMDEIEAAQHNRLPNLITFEDVKGTFHCHTVYSDGSNTPEALAEAAQKLGWEYLGIADHSKAAAYAGGLDERQLKLQMKEIDKLNSIFNKFRLLKGTEVDILPDGNLDWSNGILERLDFVIASIHSKFKMTEVEATKRTIKAIKNKHVTMLGHPTGRLLLERDGYPVNMIDVINAAADYGKIIEINAHPQRLDLDWRFGKYAKEKSVKISINPDAHNLEGLNDVLYGVGIARKGWCEKSDIINTMNLEDILQHLQLT